MFIRKNVKAGKVWTDHDGNILLVVGADYPFDRNGYKDTQYMVVGLTRTGDPSNPVSLQYYLGSTTPTLRMCEWEDLRYPYNNEEIPGWRINELLTEVKSHAVSELSDLSEKLVRISQRINTVQNALRDVDSITGGNENA